MSAAKYELWVRSILNRDADGRDCNQEEWHVLRTAGGRRYRGTKAECTRMGKSRRRTHLLEYRVLTVEEGERRSLIDEGGSR